MSRAWFAIAREQTTPEIRIFDEIGGYGISARTLVDEIGAIDAKEILVRINTPGGEVTEGTAIYNALRAHPAFVRCRIEGLAASAGSFVAMAGDEVLIADNAYMMIHEARGGAFGVADDMTSVAAALEKMNENIAAMYAAKTGKPRAYWRDKMKQETWYTAEEAIADGLADSVWKPGESEPVGARAKFSLVAYNRVPRAVAERFAGGVGAMSEANQNVPAANATAAATTDVAVADGVAALNQHTLLAVRENSRRAGIEEGMAQAREMLKALYQACEKKPLLAIECFIGGVPIDAAKMRYESELARDRAEEEARQRRDAEIARLNALLAIGGHPGLGAMPAPATPAPIGLDPRRQAEAEWDRNPELRAGFTTKENYVAFRAMELRGQYRTQR